LNEMSNCSSVRFERSDSRSARLQSELRAVISFEHKDFETCQSQQPREFLANAAHAGGEVSRERGF
jgi:hypothetical protein